MPEFDLTRHIALDVETYSDVDPAYKLEPCRALTGEARVRSMAITWYDGNKLKSRTWFEPDRYTKHQLLEWLAKQDKRIVGWNIPFDIAWFLADNLYAEVMNCQWLDGMLLWRHAMVEPEPEGRRKKKWGLKECVAENYPGCAGYDEHIDFDTTTEDGIKDLLEYNKFDTAFTFKLARKYWNVLTDRQQRVALIEAQSLPLFAYANLHGIEIDVSATKTLSERLTITAVEKLAELQAIDPRVTPAVIASPKQLSTLLYQDWGLPVLKQTDKGADSTDKEALYELAFIDPRAKTLKEYREAVNNNTKFAIATLTSVEYNSDGKTRPAARVYGTYTGRVTYASKTGRGKNERPTGVALHQWKRNSDFRREIKAPEGYTLCEFDFAGQEFRWMAVASGDEKMLALCLPGEDAHTYMGHRVWVQEDASIEEQFDYHGMIELVRAGDKAAKSHRQLGKVSNLSCIAANEKILTDRGYVAIQNVTSKDRLWDGVEWVTHDGVIFQGYREVMQYAGIKATPDHKVFVGEKRTAFAEAAQMGWKIQSPLGTGWPHRTRAAFRIMDGLIRRAFYTVWCTLCNVSMQLWYGKGSQPAIYGDRQINTVQTLRLCCDASSQRQIGSRYARQESIAETCSIDAAAMHKPKRSLIQKLWWARHRVQVFIYKSWRRVFTRDISDAILYWLRYRQDRCKRPLRARQFTFCNTQRESRKQATYDILNAGSRNRFTVGSCIVSNCQYRTSARKLRSVARVQYDIPLTQPQADTLHSAYRGAYPGVPEYWQRQIAKGRTQGYIENLAGRRVQLRGDWTNRNDAWALESTAINFPIQGIGADQKYLAIMLLRDYLPRVGGYFYFELHDGIHVLLPNKVVMQEIPRIKTMLSNLPYKKAWGIDLPIQFPVDAKYGPSWGDEVEWKE